MRTTNAPIRIRSLPSWLLAQCAVTAGQIVAAQLSRADANRYHYSLLSALDEFGPMSQAALGGRIGLDRSDTSGAVADLVGRQLVERAPDPADRRRNIVRITTSGIERLALLDRIVAEAQAELLAPLLPEEREQLVAFLTRVADARLSPP